MSRFYDAAFWREMADEIRAMSENVTDADAKVAFLNVIASYEWMAQVAERGPVPPPQQAKIPEKTT